MPRRGGTIATFAIYSVLTGMAAIDVPAEIERLNCTEPHPEKSVFNSNAA